jgi:subtilase family protein
MKDCAKCKQSIDDDAVRCHHCTSWVTSTPADGERVVYILDKGLIFYARFAGGVLAVFLLVGAFFFGYDLQEASEIAHDAKRDTAALNIETSKILGATGDLLEQTKEIKLSCTTIHDELKAKKTEIEQLVARSRQATTAIEETELQQVQRIRSEIDSVLLQRLEGILDEKQVAGLRSDIGVSGGESAFELVRQQAAFELIGVPEASKVVNGDQEVIVALPIARVIELPSIRDRVIGATVAADSATQSDAVATAAASVILGVAPSAKVLAIDVLGNGLVADSDILRAYKQAAEEGARVLCASLGSQASADEKPSSAYVTVVRRLREGGVVVVCSAGNEGPINRWTSGIIPEAITVATTDNSAEAASFTGLGDWVDVAAPGVDIVALSPTGKTRRLNGGTFSSAICAGVVAQIIAANPDLSVEEVEAVLLRSAQELEDKQLGAGLVDALESVRQSKSHK